MKISFETNNINMQSRLTLRNSKHLILRLKQYFSEGKNVKEIAKLEDRHEDWIKSAIKRFNIDCPEKLLMTDLQKESKKIEAIKQLPILINKFIPIKEMSSTTTLSQNFIENWVKKTYNCSLDHLYQKMKTADETFDIINKIQEGKSLKQINKNLSWIKKRVSDKTISTFRPNPFKIIDEKAPFMIQYGFSDDIICKKLNVTKKVLNNWSREKFNVSIFHLRKKLRLEPQFSKQEDLLEKEFFIKCLEKYKTIREAAVNLNMTSQKIIQLLNKYKLKSNAQKKQNKIKSELPDILNQGYSIEQAANYFGVTKSTIYKYKNILNKNC